MAIETGALEQAYVKVESAFAVQPAAALAAGDAFRHTELSLTSKKNREASTQKRGTPDEFTLLPRRQTSNFSGTSEWEPSGTVGTPSDVGVFLKAGMGASHAAALTTTVASAASATGATLTSATGLQVGDVVFVELPDGTREATRIKTTPGANAVTWDELSDAPDVAADVISGVTYGLASSLAESLALYKYYNAGGFKQAVYGAIVERLQVSIDGTREVTVSYSGPAALFADSTPNGGTVQNKPASHTTVGAPVSGLIGAVNLGTATALISAIRITLANNIELRNKEIGTAWASGIAGRTANRRVTVSLTLYLEDTTTISNAHGLVETAIRAVVGDPAEGMLAVVMPRVEFEIPDIGNETGPKEFTVEGVVLATDGNDSLYLAEA